MYIYIYIVSQVVVAVEEVRITLGVLIAAEQSRDSPATPIHRHPPHAASPIDISPASLIHGHQHASPINIEHAARQSDAWRLWRQETLGGGGVGGSRSEEEAAPYVGIQVTDVDSQLYLIYD